MGGGGLVGDGGEGRGLGGAGGGSLGTETRLPGGVGSGVSSTIRSVGGSGGMVEGTGSTVAVTVSSFSRAHAFCEIVTCMHVVAVRRIRHECICMFSSCWGSRAGAFRAGRTFVMTVANACTALFSTSTSSAAKLVMPTPSAQGQACCQMQVTPKTRHD